MTVNVKTDTTILMARATCGECGFDRGGREAPQAAVQHVRDTGHLVSLNTNSFTVLSPEQD